MTNQKFIINIEDIETSKNKKLQLKIEEFISGINSKKPIKADLELSSLGEFINIKGSIQGNVTFECDLCLKEFEHNIDFEVDEMFAKNALIEDDTEEIELKEGQFITDLKGAKEIDVLDFLYQSVILDFPNKKVCGINCKGGDIFIRDEDESEKDIDPRMAIFKEYNIKDKN